MSEEFDHQPETTYSSFWPLLILLIGLLGWAGYQDFAANSQRNVYEQQFQAALPTINEAQNIRDRYVALMKDLVQTAQKDSAANQIVKDAIQAHMIQVQPNATNSAAAPAEPAK
jgi:hypothetical protein